MPTVGDFLENLKKVDVKSLTKAVVAEKSVQVRIVDLNREDQIAVGGIDSKGKPLLTYAASTQRFYDANPPNDTGGMFKDYKTPYNLFWTGKSYYGFRAYVKGNKLYITTNPRGRKLLILNGGDEIFGLTDGNAAIANWEIIAPKLNESIRKILI